MSDLELMRMHVHGLFTHDARGRMVPVNEPGGAPAPRFFLGRTAEGSVWRFRHDVDDDLARELERLCRAEPAGDDFRLSPGAAETYAALLAPVQRTWAGPAYHVPRDLPASGDAVRITTANAELLRPHLEAWLGDVATAQPLLVSAERGRAVSICASVRITSEADEAGVETAAAFRGRGHAARAVSAWAAAVRELGRVPLYSTSWENAASQALARSLGLRRFGADLHIG